MWANRFWADRFWAPRYWTDGGTEAPPPPPPPPPAADATGGWLYRERLRRRLKTLRAERAALRREARRARKQRALPTVTPLGPARPARTAPSQAERRPLPDVSAHDAAIAAIEARIAATLRDIAEEDRRHRARMQRQMREDEEILLLFF